MTKKELTQLVDAVAISIQQLANDLESREKAGDILEAKEIRKVADRLRAHVTNLLAAVGEEPDGGPKDG